MRHNEAYYKRAFEEVEEERRRHNGLYIHWLGNGPQLWPISNQKLPSTAIKVVEQASDGANTAKTFPKL